MISQTKRSDLPRPAVRVPLRKYLPPPAHVSALRAQKRERILSDGSLLLSLLCGAEWLLCFSLARPFVHATTIPHHNVSWCLMFRLCCQLLSCGLSLCLLLLLSLPVCLLPPPFLALAIVSVSCLLLPSLPAASAPFLSSLWLPSLLPLSLPSVCSVPSLPCTCSCLLLFCPLRVLYALPEYRLNISENKSGSRYPHFIFPGCLLPCDRCDVTDSLLPLRIPPLAS